MGQISLGTTVTLTCTVADDPTGAVIWMKDDEPLPSTVTVVGNILTIDQVQANDNGNYICIAANGRATLYILTVTSEPYTITKYVHVHA